MYKKMCLIIPRNPMYILRKKAFPYPRSNLSLKYHNYALALFPEKQDRCSAMEWNRMLRSPDTFFKFELF